MDTSEQSPEPGPFDDIMRRPRRSPMRPKFDEEANAVWREWAILFVLALVMISTLWSRSDASAARRQSEKNAGIINRQAVLLRQTQVYVKDFTDKNQTFLDNHARTQRLICGMYVRMDPPPPAEDCKQRVTP